MENFAIKILYYKVSLQVDLCTQETEIHMFVLMRQLSNGKIMKLMCYTGVEFFGVGIIFIFFFFLFIERMNRWAH